MGNFADVLKNILMITFPLIQNLIKSRLIPAVKREAYEKFDTKANAIIADLAQNAGKIASEKDELKKDAYAEGTRLGVDTLRAVADKLTKAADEIEKAL